MEALTILLMVTILIEFIIQTVKEIINEGSPNWYMLGAVALGVLVSILAEIDAFALVGVEFSIPYVGPVLTGAVVGRGSNAVHDIIKKLGGLIK